MENPTLIPPHHRISFCPPDDIDTKTGLARSYISAFLEGPWNEKHHTIESVLETFDTLEVKHGASVLSCKTPDGMTVGGAVIGPLSRRPKIVSYLPVTDIDCFYLAELWVAPSTQSTGLGSALLTACESFSARNGASKTLLWTHFSDMGLHKFYTERGYISEDKGLNIAGSDIPRRVYRKALL